MARVFISSTFQDLAQYRDAARKVLTRLGHKLAGKESAGADDGGPRESNLSQIDAADFVVLIVARRYGPLVGDRNQSWTEAEYEFARRANKTVLAFLLGDDATWPAGSTDKDESLVARFRKRLLEELSVSYFYSVEDFTRRLEAAVKGLVASREANADSRDVAAPAPAPASIAVTLEDLPLAWRLVAGSFAEPELLRSLDPAMFVAAVEKWEQSNNQTAEAPWTSRLARAKEALDAAQPDHRASELWLAWMRATRPSKPVGGIAS